MFMLLQEYRSSVYDYVFHVFLCCYNDLTNTMVVLVLIRSIIRKSVIELVH